MFRSILCAIDFSEGSDRALEVAVAWAERARARLELIHVLEPPIYTVPDDVTTLASSLYGSLSRELEALMEERLATVRERVPAALGTVVTGQSHREILARADAMPAELIVMGTSGLGRVARTILGSVADRVLRSSSRPVLLVPWGGRDVAVVPELVVAPTDFSLAAQHAVSRTVALAVELGARVEVLHTFEVPAFVERDPKLAEGLRKAIAVEVVDVHRSVVDHPGVRTSVREGSPARTIVEVTEELRADLVAMASTGRGLVSSLLLGGVTDRVVRMSSVPVLVLRSAT